ncbi:MAG: protein-disulfide reductase DsbD family protein [Verrucomicrobiales bacterium]|nr:protein-disulfide reductase DsbD family protein [Verrucomicrobiales bacterium]
MAVLSAPTAGSSGQKPLHPMRTLAIFALLLNSLQAEPATPTKGIDLQLVSDVTTIAPATPFTVALHIHHHEGYHTYWKAPGIVGLPTGLKWELPTGYTASTLAWPAPEFTHMFQYLAYGYEHDALLLTTITPPQDLPNVSKLTARATWMACADTCQPGTRLLSIELPAASTAKPDASWLAKINTAKKSVPRTLDTLKSPTATIAGKNVTLSFTAPDGVPIEKLHFLSDHNLFDPNTPQLQSPTGLALTIMPDAPKQLPTRLSGLLHNPTGWPSLGGAKFGRINLPLAKP